MEIKLEKNKVTKVSRDEQEDGDLCIQIDRKQLQHVSNWNTLQSS